MTGAGLINNLYGTRVRNVPERVPPGARPSFCSCERAGACACTYVWSHKKYVRGREAKWLKARLSWALKVALRVFRSTSECHTVYHEIIDSVLDRPLKCSESWSSSVARLHRSNPHKFETCHLVSHWQNWRHYTHTSKRPEGPRRIFALSSCTYWESKTKKKHFNQRPDA